MARERSGGPSPPEEGAATPIPSEGLTTYRLAGVAATDPWGFKSHPLRHEPVASLRFMASHIPLAEFTLNPSAASGSGLGYTAPPPPRCGSHVATGGDSERSYSL